MPIDSLEEQTSGDNESSCVAHMDSAKHTHADNIHKWEPV